MFEIARYKLHYSVQLSKLILKYAYDSLYTDVFVDLFKGRIVVEL